MRRRVLPILIGCLLASLAGLPSGSGQQSRPADDSRAEFLKSFRRIPVNTPPEDALFLRILVQCRQAQRGIEVGSANGYGAVNMGIGFERTGGRLFTIDIDPAMVKQCRENLAQAGLEKTVTCLEGDALKVLPALEGEFDFLFLDAVKADYLKYFQAVRSRLKPGAVVAAHNAVSSADEMKDFLDFMRESPDWEMVIVRTGRNADGMAVCYKKK
jgi:predicted O-methyltransferase YrrM